MKIRSEIKAKNLLNLDHRCFIMSKRKIFQRIVTILIIGCTSAVWLKAQPSPGELYREYRWFNASGDCNGALRVGGSLDYRISGTTDNYTGDGLINPPFRVELNRAIRAELVVEKMLCHAGTEGLRVSINGHDPLSVPEPEHIPKPQSAYAHHLNLVLPVELSLLRQGNENTFCFEVDTAGHWWPQNLVYGMILRVYYEPSTVAERGAIIYPSTGDTLGLRTRIALDLPVGEKVEKIDIVGLYEDVDLEGDGLYRQWHYGYHQGRIYNHIGTLTWPPLELTWNTEWIPDQPESMELAAFVHRSDGYVYMTDPVKELVLERPEISVELCKPYKRPEGWFTREGEFSERFQVRGNLEKATDARLVCRTWSPGYFNGIYVNGFLVFIREGPRYDYAEHRIAINELYVLKEGENILKTGMTPRYDGTMVHGVEVQWPGIMVLIRYMKDP